MPEDQTASPTRRPPRLTVAISTRNRRPELQETIRRLAAQAVSFPWELLVVANACTDDTEPAVRELAARFPVHLRCESERRPGLSHGRNRALASSRAPLVVFVDDDVSCADGLLAGYARAFEDATLVAAGGPVVPTFPGALPGWIAENLDAGWVRGPLSYYDCGEEVVEVGGAGRPHTPFGANFGVRRAAALAAGGFRTDLGWGAGVPGEETEFFERLGRRGRILYLPDCRVEHRLRGERLTPEYLQRYHYALGRAKVRLAGRRARGHHLLRILRESLKVAGQGLRAQLGLGSGPEALAARARTRGRLREHVARLGR